MHCPRSCRSFLEELGVTLVVWLQSPHPDHAVLIVVGGEAGSEALWKCCSPAEAGQEWLQQGYIVSIMRRAFVQ